jgi:glyoxylase-like metal-dependent hydrolase (beta-lactamase superfamily II)
MLKWKIGDVTISRVVEMEIPIPYNPDAPFLREAKPDVLKSIPWLKPHFITDDGAMKMPFQAFLVEAPGFKLVVDTCVGNDKPRKELGMQALHTSFLEDVERAGFDRHSVDSVVCTHLHIDHVGWNTMLKDDKWVPTFPNARYLIGRKEFDHWHDFDDADQQQIMADSVTPIFDAGLADMVEMDHAISPEVRLVPTAGHTPGHVSVLIESRGESAIITGDMMHHPCQIAHPDWSPDFDTDKKAAAATRRAMLKDWADQPILVIGTHFSAPTAGHVVKDGDTYRFDPV